MEFKEDPAKGRDNKRFETEKEHPDSTDNKLDGLIINESISTAADDWFDKRENEMFWTDFKGLEGAPVLA